MERLELASPSQTILVVRLRAVVARAGVPLGCRHGGLGNMGGLDMAPQTPSTLGPDRRVGALLDSALCRAT